MFLHYVVLIIVYQKHDLLSSWSILRFQFTFISYYHYVTSQIAGTLSRKGFAETNIRNDDVFSSPNYGQLVTLPFLKISLHYLSGLISWKMPLRDETVKGMLEIDLLKFFDCRPKPYNQIKPLSSEKFFSSLLCSLHRSEMFEEDEKRREIKLNLNDIRKKFQQSFLASC